MSYRIVLSQEAITALEKQIDWYNAKQEGLWQRFFNQVWGLLELLTHYPEQFELKKPPYRVAKVNKFPILLIYEVEQESVYVYQIFNTNKDPKKMG